MAGNGRKWMEMEGKDLTRMEMAGHGWKTLEVDGKCLEWQETS